MKIVKLNAIDSTNTYLKELAKNKSIENWTVITTDHQTNGKGQFDNVWISDQGKNLTISILVKHKDLKIAHQYYLNHVVSIAIYNVLKYYISEKLSVKWPNDIMSAGQKICGILIENVLKKTKVVYSIIGIGLNVNQTVFPKQITNVTSLKKILQRKIDKDELTNKIIMEIQYQFLFIQQKKFNDIKQIYEKLLYKKGIPSMFVDSHNNKFLGKIIGITTDCKLQIEMDNENLQEFDLKEIKFA
jgi:BirA family biotin operon repressor/biotin-[acetyl-CoA-carboxylase] ligase